jgi:hypothetical protein
MFPIVTIFPTRAWPAQSRIVLGIRVRLGESGRSGRFVDKRSTYRLDEVGNPFPGGLAQLSGKTLASLTCQKRRRSGRDQAEIHELRVLP